MDEENSISTSETINQGGPAYDRERAYLELLIRSDYGRCHPDETLEDLERRARFSKEDKGLLRDWLSLAAQRAIASRSEQHVIDIYVAV